VAVIANWVKRKLGIPFPKAQGVAFAIARSIGKRGLQPRRVLTSPQMTSDLSTMMEEEVLRELLAAFGVP
jgi:hypothetical protein